MPSWYVYITAQDATRQLLTRLSQACVWYGTQAWLGGQAVYCLILAIWPSFARLHNGIPSSGTDTAHFLCFFLFSLVSLVPIWFPIHQIRHLFSLKAIVAPVAGIALFAICIGKAHGAGELMHARATVGGSTLAWAFLGSAMGSVANMATLITNVSPSPVDAESVRTRVIDIVSRSRSTLPRALVALPTSSGRKSFRCPSASLSLRSSVF